VIQNQYAWNPIDPERLILVISPTGGFYCLNPNSMSWVSWLASRGLPVVTSDRMADQVGALFDSRSFPVIAPEEVLNPPASAAPKWRPDGTTKKRPYRGRLT
jgi:hypothetical protein